MSPAVLTKNLSHDFNGNPVLDGIDIAVERGEIFGLLGPSGAGKTTLINILTGQLKPSDGESYIFGTPSFRMTGGQRKNMGIMMDHFGLYERMSCYDNLRFYQMLCGGEKKTINEILEDTGLLEAKKTLVMNLSKGMKNRLAFARAVLFNPDILFLDEPTSGLDPAAALAIRKMIAQRKENGVTIFLTTHNMHEAEQLCDRTALLCGGKIVECGAPSSLCRKYNHQKKIKIHLADGQDIAISHGAESGETIKDYFMRDEIVSIHSTEPDLETIFMELTGRKLT